MWAVRDHAVIRARAQVGVPKVSFAPFWPVVHTWGKPCGELWLTTGRPPACPQAEGSLTGLCTARGRDVDAGRPGWGRLPTPCGCPVDNQIPSTGSRPPCAGRSTSGAHGDRPAGLRKCCFSTGSTPPMEKMRSIHHSSRPEYLGATDPCWRGLGRTGRTTRSRLPRTGFAATPGGTRVSAPTTMCFRRTVVWSHACLQS